MWMMFECGMNSSPTGDERSWKERLHDLHGMHYAQPAVRMYALAMLWT